MSVNVIDTAAGISPLRAKRRSVPYSIEKLAALAGVSSSTIRLAEKAPQTMSERTARAVAKVLRCRVQDLQPIRRKAS